MFLKVQGRDTYCYTGGKSFNSSLPTLVFVHGAEQDHTAWDQQSPYFTSRGFSVLAIDLPGHGRTYGKPLISIEAHATWLLALLDAAQVSQATLIGHSMGALIALESTFHAPQRVAKLILLGTTFPMMVGDKLLDIAKEDPSKARKMIYFWSHHSEGQRPRAMASWLKIIALTRCLTNCLFNPPHLLHVDLRACNLYANGIVAAKSVQCPTLFIFAKQDKMTPTKGAAALIDALPSGKIVVIEDCGHALMEEQPEAVLAALRSFLL